MLIRYDFLVFVDCVGVDDVGVPADLDHVLHFSFEDVLTLEYFDNHVIVVSVDSREDSSLGTTLQLVKDLVLADLTSEFVASAASLFEIIHLLIF